MLVNQKTFFFFLLIFIVVISKDAINIERHKTTAQEAIVSNK